MLYDLVDEVEQGSTFFGVDMAQAWSELQLYERILNAHPELKMVIELGTGSGGLSHYLGAQCSHRDIKFMTFDHSEPPAHVPGWHLANVLENALEVASHFHSPMLLICDDGDKPLEMSLYTPHLLPHDLLAVHDWGTEVQEADVPDHLIMVYEEWCKGRTRMFMKAGHG